MKVNNDARYNLTNKNRSEVSTYAPIITVFTHEWNGNKYLWVTNDVDH